MIQHIQCPTLHQPADVVLDIGYAVSLDIVTGNRKKYFNFFFVSLADISSTRPGDKLTMFVHSDIGTQVLSLCCIVIQGYVPSNCDSSIIT